MDGVERKRGISGSTVKIVAVVTMLIDHIGAVILMRQVLDNGYPAAAAGGPGQLERWMAGNAALYDGMMIMRNIGRLGFPIFCFLLVEGFQRSKDLRKYALRLGMFALLSEIPFNLAVTGRLFHFGYQNVYFTLLFGLLALCGYAFLDRRKLPAVPRILLMGMVLTAMMALAELLRTDYGGMGVLTITVMYLLRRHKVWGMAAGCVVLTVLSLSELPAFLAILPIALYNGSRGMKMKYFFYVFYPLHLFLLYGIAVWMGLGGILLF